uniref:Chaperonin GroEL n=1 Tax=Mallomonas splendens TaxID=52552 RepID=A0A3G2R085_9STRA|nr:chaperonin GroEL [Mallomonas splendens]AYO28521.1 chaperonin GroEL [Mallomonas splendens]
MRKNFSLFKELENNIQSINNIDNSIKITLGPTGKNGIVANKQGNLKIITSGSFLLNVLEFSSISANVILKLFQQASSKTYTISGDGSTTTVLFACELLKLSLKLLSNGYNSILISNGFKKISYFLIEKILEYSIPVSTANLLSGVLKTHLGKKISPSLFELLQECLFKIQKDGLILVEENLSEKNEIEIIQGIELDKGFASSYFVTDLKNFEVIFEKPYLLITSISLDSINQIRDIIEYIKTSNRPLVIVAEEINKDVISTLVLNNLQKKIKIVVIRYKGIEFKKTGILEDLSLLTHSNYFDSKMKRNNNLLTIEDLGQVEKVIVGKNKSSFIFSKFTKLLAQRRINELNRELLTSETEYEKNLVKTRIARLSGQITRIKIGISNKYETEEQRQKIENALQTIKSSLEEGVLPGGGAFYLNLKEELLNWSSINLVGEELAASFILSKALSRPFQELLQNTNTEKQGYQILEKLIELGYPYGYNVIENKIVNSINEGLLDSAKSVRGILWNSISIISTLITSE